MGSIKLHLRKSDSKGEYPGHLFVRFIHKGKSLSLTLPYLLHPTEWDAKRRAVIITRGSPRAAVLEKVSTELGKETARAELLVMEMEEGGPYTVYDLKAAFARKAGGVTLKEYAGKLSGEMKGLGHKRTSRAYMTAVNRLAGFTGNEGINLEELDGPLLKEFERFLRNKGLMRNTIAFYMSILRAIYNKAVAEKLFVPRVADIFKDVCTTGEATKKRALSVEEMAMLHTLEVPRPALKKSLLVFLFSFFARGIPFVDLFHLRKEDIRDGVLYYRRKKTGQALEVQVTTEMRHILDLLEGDTEGSPFLLPLAVTDTPAYSSYQSALRLQNKRLNKIGELCGLAGRLSTHVARHSWATAAKAAGLSVAVISEGLGHTSVATTTIYLAAFDRPILDKANEEVSRMVTAAVA